MICWHDQVLEAAIEYQDLRARLTGSRRMVEDLVNAVEKRLAVAVADVTIENLRQDYPSLPFSPRVWDAWLGNAIKMQGVRRLDKAPYATHPTRMALICCWLLKEGDGRDDSAVLALLHDYLEEGDGLTIQGIKNMRARFPKEPAAALAAVVLSEPLIDYAKLGDAAELSFWRRVAYVVQAKQALSSLGIAAFANAALSDKIDNLHDLDYIALDVRQPAERRATKLRHRLGYFLYVKRALEFKAQPVFGKILDAALTRRAEEFTVSWAEVEQEADALTAREERATEVLEELIGAYQVDLELGVT